MVSVLDELVDEYLDRRLSSKRVNELINSRLFTSVYVRFEFMLEAFYLFSTVNFGPTISTLVDDYHKLMIARGATIYIVTSILALTLLILIVVPLQKKLEYFNSSIFIFPFDLIDSNPHMKMVMKMVEKNKRLH